MQVRVIPVRAGRMHIRQDYPVCVAFARIDVYQHVIRRFQRVVSAVYRIWARRTPLVSASNQARGGHLETMKVQVCMLKAGWFGWISMVAFRTDVILELRPFLESVMEL